MRLQTISYNNYERGLPQEGNYILGQTDGDTIVVYQAFNDRIADYAVHHQKFGGPDYSFSRMTWIKPNFLWMMYRSGWASKENQTRILAIEITLEGFYELLQMGVMTSFSGNPDDEHLWKEQLNNSDVRIQWDPDHDPQGRRLQRRAVQIGLKAAALHRFNNEFVKSITDITAFVTAQKKSIDQQEEDFLVVCEQIVDVDADLKAKFSIPKDFASAHILRLVQQFEATGAIDEADFEEFLVEKGGKRNELIDYVKNYRNVEFSRYLLHRAIAYRSEDFDASTACMCEDLLLFSYFVSKNGEEIDFDLIMDAKHADFDTWCGFDGEMIFYTLGFERTRAYLQANVPKFSQQTVDYFMGFSEEYLYHEINTRAFWYF